MPQQAVSLTITLAKSHTKQHILPTNTRNHTRTHTHTHTHTHRVIKNALQIGAGLQEWREVRDLFVDVLGELAHAYVATHT
jgi:hypothetical protein